jgi:transmembrane sensor
MVTEDILVKYLAGETEPHEIAMIDQWRKASADNEKHFRQLETLWKGSAGLKHHRQVDTDQAWQKVQGRIGTPSKGLRISMNTRWLVAASLTLLLGLGIFFMSRNQTSGSDMIALNATKDAQQFKLSDGSQVIIKSGQLLYPKKFDGGKRIVKLNSGKVFFDIAPDKSKPFEIEANQTLITVVGTEFEIVSYTDYTQVMVREGKVKFTTPDGEVMLTAGMGAKYVSKDQKLEEIKVKGKNTFAYTTGELVFENDRLADVVKDLNQYYDSEILIGNMELENCRITSTFPHEKLENVLAVIAGTLGLDVQHVPNTNQIILQGRGCKL